MAVLQFVVYDILGEASLLIGLLALVGLLIQKKPAGESYCRNNKDNRWFFDFRNRFVCGAGSTEWFQSLFVTAFRTRRSYAYFRSDYCSGSDTVSDGNCADYGRWISL